MAVARRPVDDDARRHQLAAQRIDVVHGIGEMAEIAPAGIILLVPILGQFDHRAEVAGFFAGRVLPHLRRRQKNQGEAAFVIVLAADFLRPSLAQ